MQAFRRHAELQENLTEIQILAIGGDSAVAELNRPMANRRTRLPALCGTASVICESMVHSMALLKTHHLHKEIAATGCEAKVQYGLAFTCGLILRLDAGLMQAVAKA